MENKLDLWGGIVILCWQEVVAKTFHGQFLRIAMTNLKKKTSNREHIYKRAMQNIL